MKILMLTSSFDIGGAETHILELSKVLEEKGHTVSVASSGGDYVKKLQEYGISHITLPLNSKNPVKILYSYNSLKKSILENEYDVIHTHARLPALIGHMLSRSTSLPMVSTAHWVFSLKQPAKMLTHWGQKTLAVSADIKNYLIDNYNIYQDNIKVTVNGIDTINFRAKKEAFVPNKIIHISRLDEGRAKTAFALISIAPALTQKYKNLKIEIIGGGDCEEKARQKATEANKACGYDAIKLLGKRTDVDTLLSNEKCVFVGVSRAVLEAMACEHPVVLSGDEGYEGIFDADHAQKSIRSNFCCRGTERLNEKTLKKDIEYLFDNERLAISLGKKNRAFIEKNYSLNRMAEDALSVYKSVLKFKSSPKVIICGYYGYGNIGDEATLEETVKELQREKISDITVLSKNPKATSKKSGIKAIYRYNFAKITRAMKECDIFMLGGGNLLQNQTSNRSLLYYGSLLKLAKKRNAKCYCYSCGIGELHGEKWTSFVKKVLMCCETVIVRTENDAKAIYELSKDIPVKASCDIVFLKEQNEQDYLEPKFSHLKGKRYALFALREPRSKRKEFIYNFSSAVKLLYDKENIFPVFIPMHEKKDKKIARDVIKAAKCGNIENLSSATEIIYLLRNSEFACGMRMHFMILSLIAETPFISVAYDTKCSHVYRELFKYIKSDIFFEEISELDFEDAFSSILNKKTEKTADTESFCEYMQKERGKFLFTLEKEE